MNQFIKLGRDPEGNPSSQPRIESGENRGWMKSEVGGMWKPMGGYCYESLRGEQQANWEWARSVESLGFKVGIWDRDGVKEFYVWVEEK